MTGEEMELERELAATKAEKRKLALLDELDLEKLEINRYHERINKRQRVDPGSRKGEFGLSRSYHSKELTKIRYGL